MEFTGVVFVCAMLIALAFSGYIRLFVISGNDAQRMMMSDYDEFLRSVGAQDSEENRALFAESYLK